jgi:hypothetical protein
MDISSFVRMSGVTSLQFLIGTKGNSTNFALLGRCSELCLYKHIARPVVDVQARAVKKALELGLKRMAAKALA